MTEYHPIAGLRRIAAAKQLGWTEVPVHVATDIDDAIKRLGAERDENVCREGFTVFNTVIEARYKTKAGGYQSTSWFSEAQLTAVEDFARQAREAIRNKKS